MTRRAREVASLFAWPVRVYYEDTDTGGVVYYANYLRFLERARTEWLRGLGFEQPELARDPGVLFVVREVGVEYLRPALFNDALQVTVGVAEIGRARLVLDQTVERDAELLVRARVTVACVNAASFKPVTIPAILKQRIENPS